MVPESVLWLKDVKKSDIAIAGGKGANLGELIRAHFPVPNGFIVTAKAYFEFLEQNNLKELIEKKIETLDVDNTKELKKVTAEIRKMILNAKMSEELKNKIIKYYSTLGSQRLAWLTSSELPFVAVRSSATAEDLPGASFAGQQETFLNVHGKEELLHAIQQCWASLFTARATYYRRKKGFKTSEVGIAVVVQKMVNSEAAGVMFTAEPTSGDRSKLVIEAAFGLGESVVSGKVTPDEYTVDKATMRILEKRIGKQEWKIIRKGRRNEKVMLTEQEAMKQKITDEHIIELARLGIRIEKHYGAPQDIEWALEGGELYIVQSRPITTLQAEKRAKKKGKKEGTLKPKAGKLGKLLVEGIGASPGTVSGPVKVVPSIKDIGKVKEGDILVTRMTSPDWVPIMRKSKAIITDEGGKTCHAAIVSRELGIPCVVGTYKATKVLKDHMMVTVDGAKGKVYEGAITEPVKEERAQEVMVASAEQLKELFGEEDKTALKALELLLTNATKVKVNVALPEAAKRAAATGAEGVGLLRAEHMITESGKHPAEYIREGKVRELIEQVKKGILAVAKEFEGKPVWYRTFDARTDEFENLKGGEKEPKESNPMLGWHGIRRDLDQPELLKAQFIAIKELREEGYKNVGIMLPFVQSCKEVREAKKIAEECGLDVNAPDLQFGVMVETPAAALTIDQIIEEGIDFISFGTNDLTQLTLGIDRNNELIQKHFNELHPAVLRQIKDVIEKCKKAGVETSICGQAGSNPAMVKLLVRWGIDSVSANIDAVQKIKHTVLVEEKNMLLEHISALTDFRR
jgi:pyruvate,water dikinase